MIAGCMLFNLACGLNRAGTAIPAGRPVAFDVQTSTPTPDRTTAALEVAATGAIIVPLGNAPTLTPDPNATPTRAPQPAATPTLPLPPTPEITPTLDRPTPRAVAVPTQPKVTPDLPLQGGDWDFESDFIPWPNPHGEPCPGAAVASGWNAFVERGEFGSSCLNENLYSPNIFSGLKSQEITFDFIAANSGLYRTIPTKAGRRYNIMAYAKHDRSAVPVQMFLGVDLSGGVIWNGDTVQWFAWDNNSEDTWAATAETITATGESMTIFIRGLHPVAEQGGKTVIDNVSVTDLGL